MSGQATGWVLRYGPRPDMVDRNGTKYGARARGMRAVLVGVADAANSEGHHSHPGIDNLCSFSLYGRRQVSTLLSELNAEGWLTVEEQGGGKGKATVYGLPLMAITSLRSLHGYEDRYSASSGGEQRSADPHTVQSDAHTAQPWSAQQRPINEPSNETPNGEPATQLARLDEWPDDLPDVVVKSGFIDTARELSVLLESTLIERGFTDVAGKGIGKRWLLDMEALLRIDERPAEQVRWVIRWLSRGDDEVAAFWRSNIRSPAKLRYQWVTMRERYHALHRTTQSRTGQQFDRAVREAGHDPSEVAADSSALVRSMFGSDPVDEDRKPLTSEALDVESREG